MPPALAVAILLAGPFCVNHSSNDCQWDWRGLGVSPCGNITKNAMEFKSVYIDPLQGKFSEVAVFISSEPGDEKLWMEHYPYAIVETARKLPDLDETGFAPFRKLHYSYKRKGGTTQVKTVPCSRPYCHQHYVQIGHMWNAFQMMLRYQADKGRNFTHLIKTRAQFFYKPGQFLRPEWLLDAKPGEILTPATIYNTIKPIWTHENDRNHYMNDQVLFGRAEVTSLYFTIFTDLTVTNTTLYEHRIEAMEYLRFRDNNCTFTYVDLQYGKFHPKFCRISKTDKLMGRNNHWMGDSCRDFPRCKHFNETARVAAALIA